MKTEIQEQINKYLSKLERNLRQLPKQEKEDILKEIESHIFESIGDDDNNRVEKLQTVLKKLGDPKDYARLLIFEHIGSLVEKGSFKDNFSLFVKQMKIPFVISAIFLILLMESNTIFIYANLIHKSLKSDVSLFDSILLLLFNSPSIILFSLPRIIVLIIPLCVLFAVPITFYTMVKSSENKEAIRSVKIWLMVFLFGIISSFVSFGINEIIVPYTSHHIFYNVLREINEKYTPQTTLEIIETKYSSVLGMNFWETKKQITKLKASGIETGRMNFDLYTKLSMPLACLACSIFGSFIGCLMLSGFFHKGYLVAIMGWLIPTFIWDSTYNFFYKMADKISPYSAFIPDLIIGGFGLLMIIGIFFNKKNEKPVN
jgi:lipopolysaccharide export LptBFGC system permease protein LptF